MKTLTFSCAENSSHKISVTVHRSPKAYKAAMKSFGNPVPDSVACCLQMEFPFEGGVIAELHFSRKNFTPAIVAHECYHAAAFRALLVGQIVGSDEYEEYVAEGIQHLVEAILNALN